LKTQGSILFGLVDVTAKKDSRLIVNDKQQFVDLEDLRQEKLEEIKYGTCEKNQFALDGSFSLMPNIEELINMGWWSNQMSDDKGQFETPLVMEINFTKPHSSMGLTLVFSKANDYCNHLNAKFYDINGELIIDKDFYPDNFYYVCNKIVENYAKIVLTFYSTNNPYRYLKLYRILYGVEKIFEGDNLISANVLEEVDLLSSEISINTLDFTAFSEDDEFNILNPEGYYRLLQQRQKLEVTEKFVKNGTELKMGTFYLDTWLNQRNKTMKIGGIDLIGLLDKTDFMGGMYQDVPFIDVLKEIFTSAELEENEYEIEEELKRIPITGHIDICTHREALQQVVFAVGAVADDSRGDTIKIYSIKNIDDNNLVEDIIQATRTVEQNDIVTAVEVVSHNYVLKGHLEEITKQELEAGDNKILFGVPVADITCMGGTILESNCNYAIVHCDTTGEVIISGYEYTDNLKVHTAEVANLNANQKKNTLKIEDAYLINKNNAMQVAQRVLAYYQRTYKINFDFLLKNEKLSEEIEIPEVFEQKLLGHIKKLDIDLTGGFLASTEVHARLEEAKTDG